MRLYKKITLALLIAFIAIQFIQPDGNKSGKVLSTDIIKTVNIPHNVLSVFQKACYDCHSDNTTYPWYVNVQPLGWLMASHIKEGKENLNFSEFGTYSKRKQNNKLRAISKSIEEGSMPISSYTLMHADAKLSKENKELITNWVTKTRDSIEVKD